MFKTVSENNIFIFFKRAERLICMSENNTRNIRAYIHIYTRQNKLRVTFCKVILLKTKEIPKMTFTLIHSLLSYKKCTHNIDPLTSCLQLVCAKIQTYPSEQSVN